ncbi:MAG: non-hydrolyzing UDP-N-acetylglucosamine 2-epimerase, partial [Flavisolibacter sp.]
MKITIVAGARPNFMKIAPIIKEINRAKTENSDIHYRLIHTGQHYDKKMSGDFFEQLCIPAPDVNLGAGGGTQAEQTASIMVGFEKELLENRPDVVLVVGDVTSTMACTIAAKKLCIDVVHVEAGIRSGDMTMPEEINRIVTDALCDHYFTTSEQANEHLKRTGTCQEKIHFVGNTMIDTLYQNLDKLKQPSFWCTEKMEKRNYFLLTLHRPSNVDDPNKLKTILESISKSAKDIKIVFPVHPRTKKMLSEISIDEEKFVLTEPMGYQQFIYLVKNSKAVITDSGGITEEATVLGVPCLTLRNSTERPETVTMGTNELIGDDLGKLKRCLKDVLEGRWKIGNIPPLWDGKTSERIIVKLR